MRTNMDQRSMILKDATAIHNTMDSFRQEAEKEKMLFNLGDRGTGKEYKSIDVDGIADLFERSRLEMRLKHSNSVVSRTQIIAPNPATARGFTGDVLIDEIGFIQGFDEVWEAMEPIASRDPSFRVLMASTPPRDESHLCFKIGQPPENTVFEPCGDGHWYRSEAGVLCLRVDVWDAQECGVFLHDLETRKPISPEQHRAQALDKDAWDSNYALKRIPGGLVAMPATAIDAAQEKGREECLAYDLGTIEELNEEIVLARLAGYVQNIAGPGVWGAGYDIATTTKAKSNPSGLTLTQGRGDQRWARLIIRWKCSNPKFTKRLIRRALEILKEAGGKIRKLCIDASNERFYAREVADDLNDVCDSELIVSGEVRELPGEEGNDQNKVRMKELTGNLLVNTATDRLLALPADKWVRDDFLLQKKEKGLFVCDLDSAGNHGDTFDSTKLSVFAFEGEEGVETLDLMRGDAYGQQQSRDPRPSWMREKLDDLKAFIYG
jgi:hypothetical protein